MPVYPTTYYPPKRNVEYIFYLGLPARKTVGFTVNPTIEAGDFKVSVDGGGSFSNLTTLPVVSPAGGKSVKVTLSAAEMDGANIIVMATDVSGNQWGDVLVTIQPSSLQVNDLATQESIDGIISTLSTLVADIWAYVIETGYSALASMRIILSVLAGKVSGAPDGPIVFRDVNDAKDRVTATVDGDGNRDSITTDVS